MVKDYSVENSDGTQFEKSIDFQTSRWELTSKEFQISIDKRSYIPSVRPFLGFLQNNSYGFQYNQVEAGISINWDAPGHKQTSSVAGDQLSYQSSKVGIESIRNQFTALYENTVTNLRVNTDLLKASWDSYLNSNSLVKLLEVQKTIGQIDAVSISNAYTQRNQTLNSMYDSMFAIDKDFARLDALVKWRTILAKAGFNLK